MCFCLWRGQWGFSKQWEFIFGVTGWQTVQRDISSDCWGFMGCRNNGMLPPPEARGLDAFPPKNFPKLVLDNETFVASVWPVWISYTIHQNNSNRSSAAATSSESRVRWRLCKYNMNLQQTSPALVLLVSGGMSEFIGSSRLPAG